MHKTFTEITDNGKSKQDQKDMNMHCTEICYLLRTQKLVFLGEALSVL